VSEPVTSAPETWDAFFGEFYLRAYEIGRVLRQTLIDPHGDFDRAPFSASTRLVVLATR